MKIQKILLFFLLAFVTFSCKKNQQISAEDAFSELGKSYEICGRCGYLAVNLENEDGDVILIHWDSPYVDYQNREKRIKLAQKNVYKDGKTYVDPELLRILGY